MTQKILTSCLLVLAAVVVFAQDDEEKSGQPQILFVAEDDQGTVWANVSLTLQQTNEPYVPIVVAVQNRMKKNVTVTRDRIWLSDLDGLVYQMPSIKEWRKNYGRTVIDRRVVSTGGIPWEVWQRSRRYSASNFFPDMRSQRGNTVIDHVSLRKGNGMVDLFYFDRPRNQFYERPFFLTVHPKGWEEPIRMRLQLN
jgi:hypothetical protein